MSDPTTSEQIAALRERVAVLESQVSALLNRLTALEQRPQVTPIPLVPFGEWWPVYRSETRTTTRDPIPDDGC